MTTVTVHIDRLVLKGFRREDRFDAAEGIRQELRRILASSDLPNQQHSDARFGARRPAVVRLERGLQAFDIGARVGQRIAHEIHPARPTKGGGS